MRRLFVLQALTALLIAYLYLYLGLYRGLSFEIAWWDIMLHFLGGFWVALLGYWVAREAGFNPSVLQLVALGLLIGGAWEVFEYLVDLQGSIFMSTELDIFKDLVNDAIGAAVGAYLARRLV